MTAAPKSSRCLQKNPSAAATQTRWILRGCAATVGLLLTILIPNQANAQLSDKSQLLIHSGSLYPQPDSKGSPLGVFTAGAPVDLLEKTEDQQWQKIKMDNGMMGYVPTNWIAPQLQANNEPIPAPLIDPNNLKESDREYGSAHLYITGAGLKARTEPNGSKTACVKHVGEPVGINFLPSDPQAWVYIGACDNENAFVKRQFLGEKPKIKEVIAQFEAQPKTDLVARRLWGERMVELAWNQPNKKLTVDALQRFLNLAQALNDPTLIYNSTVDLELAKSMAVLGTDQKRDRALNAKPIKFMVMGKEMKFDGSLKLSHLIKHLGQPIKVENNPNECSGIGEKLYHFPQAVFEVETATQSSYLIQANMAATGVQFIHPSGTFDKNTQELGFLKQAKGWVYGDPLYSPHIFAFNEYDMAGQLMHFTKGYLVQLDIYSGC